MVVVLSDGKYNVGLYESLYPEEIERFGTPSIKKLASGLGRLKGIKTLWLEPSEYYDEECFEMKQLSAEANGKHLEVSPVNIRSRFYEAMQQEKKS